MHLDICTFEAGYTSLLLPRIYVSKYKLSIKDDGEHPPKVNLRMITPCSFGEKIQIHFTYVIKSIQNPLFTNKVVSMCRKFAL